MLRPAATSIVAIAAITSLVGCVSDEGQTPQDLGGDVAAPAAPPPRGKRVGIVLAHGLGGSVDSFDPAIVDALRADGFYVLRDSVPPVDSVATRAAALSAQLSAFISTNGLDTVHIIAHSMGGLDSRYLLSKLGAPKVKSLTTLSTPHRGSPLADLALGITRSLTVSQQDAILALTEFLGPEVTSAELGRALTDLAEANAAAFNAATLDVPGVAYASYAGFSTLFGVSNPHADEACAAPGVAVPEPASLPGLLRLAGPIVAGGLALRPHDGVVPIDSARWGAFAGCIPADHLDMTRAGAKPVEDLDLPLVPFYRQIAQRLAR